MSCEVQPCSPCHSGTLLSQFQSGAVVFLLCLIVFVPHVTPFWLFSPFLSWLGSPLPGHSCGQELMPVPSWWSEGTVCCWLWSENNHSEISELPQKCKKMGWEHQLIVLLHTVILVTVPDSTFLPRVKWKLQIHVVMKQFQSEHSVKNYKVGKTQSCVSAGWEGSELIKASSSLEEFSGVYWKHSASAYWMQIKYWRKADVLWHYFD